MKHRSWPLLALAFGLLILLLALSGAAMYGHVGRISEELARTQRQFQESAHLLSDLRLQVDTLAIRIRDYLLDTSPGGVDQRQELVDLHASIQREIGDLAHTMGSEHAAAVRQLQGEFDRYWTSISAILLIGRARRPGSGAEFLRDHVVPRRTDLILVANEIGALNASFLKQRQDLIATRLAELRRYLLQVFAAASLLGFVIAGMSMMRMAGLERSAERHRLQVEQSRGELRGLSLQLVKAQEEERKSLSRELHDQVGQMLTALRMELGNVESLQETPPPGLAERLYAAKSLAEQTLRSVRDLAMGLRPSLLDDLGLASALRWQARDFARRSGIPVDVQIEGNLDRLPERHRTCVYRVVQEALTNCERHSRASSIRITCHGGEGMVSLTVQDDGAGFDPEKVAGRGVGLLGIEERVRELGGRVSAISQPGRGALLRAEIPLPEGTSV